MLGYLHVWKLQTQYTLTVHEPVAIIKTVNFVKNMSISVLYCFMGSCVNLFENQS